MRVLTVTELSAAKGFNLRDATSVLLKAGGAMFTLALCLTFTSLRYNDANNTVVIPRRVVSKTEGADAGGEFDLPLADFITSDWFFVFRKK